MSLPVLDLEYTFSMKHIHCLYFRKELEKRPVSSGYIQAHDLSTVPDPRSIIPPFEDVLKFKSQYEEDGLYIDLVRLSVVFTIFFTIYLPYLKFGKDSLSKHCSPRSNAA